MIIPYKQLIDLGFREVKPRLFLKEFGNLQFYRDYRKDEPKSYGYAHNDFIDVRHFKEHKALIQIEHYMNIPDNSLNNNIQVNMFGNNIDEVHEQMKMHYRSISEKFK